MESTDIKLDQKLAAETKKIVAMSAGAELNALIQQRVFKATPLTDLEFALLRVSWESHMPSWMSQRRPFKVQLTKRELDGRRWQLEQARANDPEVFATYRLQWPQDYSGDVNDAARVIWQMRADGWMYEFCDMDQGKLRSVKFRRAIWKGKEFAGEIGGMDYAGTDALAVCRAALCALIELDAAIGRGCHVEEALDLRLNTEEGS